ncbi:MAG: AI-2E family transporter [Desulfobacterales bacterium]|nr:AI-2E family transporter [Desulfobacterales bacterium]
MNGPRKNDVTLWVFLAYFSLSIGLIAWLFWPFGSTLIMACVVTGLFNPIYKRVRRRTTPSLAAFITCALIFLLVFVPIALFAGILAQEAFGLYNMGRTAEISQQLRQLAEGSHALEFANALLAPFGFEISVDQLQNAFSELGKNVGLFLYRQAQAIASNIFKFIVNFSFMLLVCYYLFADGQRLLGFIFDISPLPQDQEERLVSKFQDMAGAILIGNGVSAIIQGVLGGCIFALFGLQSPILWGVIMGLLAFLPIVGIGVVFLPATIILFLTGRHGAGLFFIVFYVVITLVIEYLFKPRIVGKRVQMHIMLVFLSIIGGLKLFGILGIIYGPLVVTAFLTLADIYQHNYQASIAPEGRGDSAPGPGMNA